MMGNIGEEDQEYLGQPITVEEIELATSALAAWKAAGTDLFLGEFY